MKTGLEVDERMSEYASNPSLNSHSGGRVQADDQIQAPSERIVNDELLIMNAARDGSFKNRL